MNKHESEVSTKPVAVNNIEVWMTMFKKACRRNWTLGVWSGRLDYGLLDAGQLDTWTLNDSSLDTGQLDSWTMDSWTQNDCTLGLWTPRRLDSGWMDAWILEPWSHEILSIFNNIYFSLIIVNAEFLMISSTLRLMYYGSVKQTANDCYNSMLLQLIL